MDSRKLAEEIMDELSGFFDGYYMSGNGYEEVARLVESIIDKYKDHEI